MNSSNEKFEILFFYSTSKYESVATKLVLNNYLISNTFNKNIVLKEIEFDRNNEFCKKYNINGVPTTLVLFNDQLRARHLGEYTNKELNILLSEVIKNY
jgi:hypothetical protein